MKFDLAEKLNKIQFDSKWALNNTSLKWGIKDFLVNKY